MAIDKKINNKNDNRGMSLIEILVTIAMILILAGPLINSLLNSRIVNSNARLTQNATTVAQDMAEKFKTIPIEELCQAYQDKYSVDTSTGIYTFSDISVDGPSGEKFLVDITLDPSAYIDGNEDEKNAVNNEKLPGMSSIYGANCIKLYKYYTSADDKLKEMFSDQVNNTTVIDNLYGTYREYLSKETDIDVTCWYSPAIDGYEYSVTLTMKYTLDLTSIDNDHRLFNAPGGNYPGGNYPGGYYPGGYYPPPEGYDSWQDYWDSINNPNPSPNPTPDPDPDPGVFGQKYIVTHTEIVEGASFTNEEVPLIYLICPIFDICNNVNGYCTDKINIRYNYDIRNGGSRPEMRFYVAEQKTTNKLDSTKQQKIYPFNVVVDGKDMSLYESNSRIKFCTNITKPSGSQVLDLTYKFKDSGISIYEMTVEVSEDNKVIAEFISTK